MTDGESFAAALRHEHRDIDRGLARLRPGMPFTAEDATVVLEAGDALRRHIYLEETFVFPPLYNAGLVAPVLIMLRQHGQIWATLDALQQQLSTADRSGTAPASSRRLAVQLQHHNAHEERVLYPAADAEIFPATATTLRAFLESGTLPSGWVCIRART